MHTVADRRVLNKSTKVWYCAVFYLFAEIRQHGSRIGINASCHILERKILKYNCIFLLPLKDNKSDKGFLPVVCRQEVPTFISCLILGSKPPNIRIF